MTDFRESRFWTDCLEPQGESAARERRRSQLREGYESFREHASLLAGEISTDLPSLTVHDGTHLDALWELAPDIGGPEVGLNPAEAFVFGGSVLLHDLGLAVGAYPGGLAEIEQTDQWRDAVAVSLFQELGRYPTKSEIDNPSQEVSDSALELTLRERHASHAKDLGHASWDHDGERLYLLESSKLRSAYASLMGQIAASHWQSVRYLGQTQNRIANPPAGFPGEWTVDVLKVAALLRLADAAHLDARRAPRLLRAIRQPPNAADLHWVFQGHLSRPTVQGDRLTFDSGEPFAAKDAAAWWLGFDLLRRIDEELRAVDTLFSDLGRDRFAARGVAGIDGPDRLVDYVEVRGWRPVDAKVVVTDVPELVERVGGAQLYGEDSTVPLRELLQNASDAIRARRLLEDLPEDWGCITVERRKTGKEVVVEVRDDGVGMTEQVLTDTLLDFGGSLWSSASLISRLPGLAGRAFESTGRFGIGFFSVLMWGSRVQVVTWPAGGSREDARVLELEHGLSARPLIRTATKADGLRGAGTIVRVWVDPETGQIDFEDGDPILARKVKRPKRQLQSLCRAVAPALDVKVNVQVGDSTSVAVRPRDWETTGPQEIVRRSTNLAGRRIWLPKNWGKDHVTEIRNADGRLVGRAGLRPGAEGAISVGGLAAGVFPHVVGLFVGGAPNLARDSAKPFVEPAAFRSWLQDQAHVLNAEWEVESPTVAATLLAYGCDPAGLPVCTDAAGFHLAEAHLASKARDEEWVICVDSVLVLEQWLEEHSVTEDRVIDIDLDADYFVIDGMPLDFSDVGLPRNESYPTLREHVTGIIAAAWDRDPHDLDEGTESVGVGWFEGEEVTISATVFRRHASSGGPATSRADART